MNKLERLLVLLMAALWAGGCVYLDASLPPCPSLLRAPVNLSIQISGAEHYNRWARAEVRDTILFRLRGPTGIVLWRYKPNVRQIDCVRVSEREVRDWISNAEILLREPEGTEMLDPTDAPAGEMLLVTSNQSRVAVDVSNLSPKGLEASRSLLCLSITAFGDSIERALRGTSPKLVANLDFPVSCSVLQQSGQKSDAHVGSSESRPYRSHDNEHRPGENGYDHETRIDRQPSARHPSCLFPHGGMGAGLFEPALAGRLLD